MGNPNFPDRGVMSFEGSGEDEGSVWKGRVYRSQQREQAWRASEERAGELYRHPKYKILMMHILTQTERGLYQDEIMYYFLEQLGIYFYLLWKKLSKSSFVRE